MTDGEGKRILDRMNVIMKDTIIGIGRKELEAISGIESKSKGTGKGKQKEKNDFKNIIEKESEDDNNTQQDAGDDRGSKDDI